MRHHYNNGMRRTAAFSGLLLLAIAVGTSIHMLINLIGYAIGARTAPI